MWHPPHRETLGVPPRLHTPFSAIGGAGSSLLNPLGEQGDFNHTYFYDTDVQTGNQRELAFQFLFFKGSRWLGMDKPNVTAVIPNIGSLRNQPGAEGTR